MSQQIKGKKASKIERRPFATSVWFYGATQWDIL